MALADDDLSPVFRQVRDALDGSAWEQTLQASRRPSVVQTSQDVQALVEDIAPKYGVDPRLVASVIGLESSGNAEAVSRKGAQGLMQLMPGTARRFGVQDPLDPAQNITGGVRYLAWLRDQFPGRPDLQLAGYHAGEGAVRNAGYAIPDAHDGNMSTQQYVQAIFSRYQRAPGPDAIPRPVTGAEPSAPAPAGETAAQQRTREAANAPLTTGGGVPPLDISGISPLRTAAEMQKGVPGAAAGPREGPPVEAGLEETGMGRIAGNVAQGAVGLVKSLFSSVVAGEVLTGLKKPGEADPLGAQRVVAALDQVEQAVAPRLGGAEPNLLDKLANGIGTSLGSLVPGAMAQKFLQGVGKAAPGIARWGGAVTSGVIEGAGEAGQLYEQMAPIVGEEEAAHRALQSFGANVVLVTLTDKLGIFGDESRLLRRTLNGVLTNGLQEAVQYDIERRELWLPSTHPGAAGLKASGWTEERGRLTKPFAIKDAGEAALIGMVIGGAGAAAVGSAVEGISAPWDRIRAQEATANGGTIDPAFTPAAVFNAAQNPDSPPPNVEPALWKRWAAYLLELLPDVSHGPGMVGGILRSERGSTGGAPLRPDTAGLPPVAPGMMRLYRGETSKPAATLPDWITGDPGFQASAAATGRWWTEDPERADWYVADAGAEGRLLYMDVPEAVAQAHLVAGLPADIQRYSLDPEHEYFLPETYKGQGRAVGSLPGSERGSTGGPSLRRGAEGLSPERYRTPAGGWVIPLKEMPSQELELQDFVKQQGGVKLAGEELRGELAAVITRAEAGVSGLQNNASGLSLQQMAEEAEQRGFIGTADKASLLEALDRSVTQSKPVYSRDARGYVPIIDDPHVQAGYQAVLDAVGAMGERTAEQVAGVRHRPAVHADAAELIASGQFTHDDIRELYPNTTLNDTMASALVQSLNTLGEQMAVAAKSYLDGGERLGSQEEASLQQLMALMAELDPYRLGVSAAQSRGLGILNDPLSGYTQYLNGLHKVLATAPEHTMGQIARRILAARPEVALSPDTLRAHPEMLEELFADHYAMIGRFKANPQAFQLEQEDSGTLGRTITPEEQALIDAAETPQGPPRTAEEWNALYQAAKTDRERAAIAQAREAWRRGMEADQRTVVPPNLNAPREATPAHPEAVQQFLLDEFQDVQASLAAYLEGHATADQAKRLQDIWEPWRVANPQLPLLQAMVQTTKPGFHDLFLEVWFNAMLSNPATHAANTLSNMVTTAWALPERFIAEQFSHGQAGGVARGEATAMLYGLVHGTQDAWAGAARSWQQGKPVSGLGREYARAPVATAANMGLDPQGGLGRFADFFFEYIGLASGGRLAGRALMAADEFFKMWNYRMELNALAYREAVQQGYEGRAWAEHVSQVITSPHLGQLQQASKDFSVLQTFQKELDPQQYGRVVGALQAVSNIQMKIPWTDQTFPVGRVIVPFVQTPANIARYALERTPMGVAFASYQADIEAGGSRADIARAKVTLGTLAMVAMAGLALSGRVTGRGPEDPELRAIWLESHPEYSVRLPGGLWVSYDRFEPLGMLIGMVGDMVQIAGEAEIPAWQRIAVAPVYAFLKNIGSKTYMQSLTQFFDAMSTSPRSKTGTVGTNIATFLQRRAAGILQPSAFLAATARAFDPAEKEATDGVDFLYARVPGWRNDVPSRRTLGGEKTIFGWGFSPEILANTVRAYWPMKLGDGLIYPADKEILANKMALGQPSRTLVTDGLDVGQVAQGTTEVDLSTNKNVRLTAIQHEKLAVLAGGNQVEAQKLGLELPTALLQTVVEGLSTQFAASPPATTLSLDDYLDWASQQPEYKAASPGPEGGKEAIFKQAVHMYRDIGRQLLFAQDDQLRQRYEESTIQKTVQRLPLGQRPEAVEQLHEAYREAGPQMRDALGLRVGAGP